MHETWLSATAQHVVDGLDERYRDEFEDICAYIASSLAFLVGQGLVTEYHIYGRDLLRYWDNVFPYLIYFSLDTMGDEDPRPVVEVHALLRSEPGLPTQARI